MDAREWSTLRRHINQIEAAAFRRGVIAGAILGLVTGFALAAGLQ